MKQRPLDGACGAPALVLFYIGHLEAQPIPRCELHACDMRSALSSYLRRECWSERTVVQGS